MNPHTIRIIAVASYFLLPGWFLGFILNNSRPTKFGTFHVRQSFGLMGLSTLVIIIVGLINYLISTVIGSFILIIIGIIPLITLWFLGIISAIQGKMKPIPYVGKTFQKWFQGL